MFVGEIPLLPLHALTINQQNMQKTRRIHPLISLERQAGTADFHEVLHLRRHESMDGWIDLRGIEII